MEFNQHSTQHPLQHRVAQCLDCVGDDLDEDFKKAIIALAYSLDELERSRDEAEEALVGLVEKAVLGDANPFAMTSSAAEIGIHLIIGLEICTKYLSSAADLASDGLKTHLKFLRAH